VLAIWASLSVIWTYCCKKQRRDGALYEFWYTIGFLSSSEFFSCCGCLLYAGNDRLFKIVYKVTHFSVKPSYSVEKINLRGNELQFEICKNRFQNNNFDQAMQHQKCLDCCRLTRLFTFFHNLILFKEL